MSIVKYCYYVLTLGNFCYLASSIQCLSHTIPLTKYFLSGMFKQDADFTKKEYKLCKEYYRVLYGLWSENCIIRPTGFKQTIGQFDDKYQGWNQNDAQEALNKLLDILHIGTSYPVETKITGTVENRIDQMQVASLKQWNKSFKDQYSFIIENFFGQYYSYIQCGKCNYKLESYDPFCTLSLPIGGESVYKCFDKFTEPEFLDDDNQWKCDKCGKYSNAKRKMFLWKLPKILMIVLKRFDYNYQKNNKDVIYPMKELNLEKYCNGYDKYEGKYDLYGVCNHIGNTYGGHYYSYCKNSDGNWYEFDDSSVRRITEDKVVNQHAYIMFYEKVE